MQDTWNKFVWKLIECQTKDVEESVYHNLIEDKLELLGWAGYRGEICHKAKVPIGSNGSIQPDILIKKNEENQFVIEVKRPNHTQRDRELKQLFSYMLQLRLKVGIYIGEHIEVFYDQPDNDADPVSVMKIELKMDSKNGATFVSLFSQDTFDKEKIGQWCEERIQEMKRKESLNRIKESLMSEEGCCQIAKSVRQYLIDTYGNEFSEQSIDEMLQTLVFSAELKTDTQTVKPTPKKQKSKKPIQPVQPQTNIPCFLTRGNLNVKGLFHVEAQTLCVLQGNVINSNVVPSFKERDKRKREEQIQMYAHEKDGQLVVTNDFLFDTPSGAAVFCIGGAANGWREWKDAQGRTLDFYRKKKEK